jgi:hypothetical protein
VLVDDEFRDALAVNGQTRTVSEDLLYSTQERWLSMLAMAMTTPARAGRAEVIARAAAAQAASEAGRS